MEHYRELEEKSKNIRKEILKMTHRAKSGHPGGSLSAVELLVSLYFKKMKYDPRNPFLDKRDRLIISKGHATPAVYSVLSEAGFFAREELETFRKLGSRLQGHVYRGVPGVELSTGSLGQGLSVAVGMALAARLKGELHRVYCLLGDGEIQEGNVWEAAMSAGHRKLSKLCAIVDYNKVQENGFVNDIKKLEPLKKKWESFGWRVHEINGHKFKDIISALDKFDMELDKPTCIIANTVKGKGVSFMEYQHSWHGKAPDDEQFEKAIQEIEGKVKKTR